MVKSPDFSDVDRIKTIIMKHYTALESSLSSNALKYAINLSSSGLNVPSKIADAWHGLRYYWQLRSIAFHFEQQKDLIIDKLLELKDLMLGVGKPHLVLSCDQPMYDSLHTHQFFGLAGISTKHTTPWENNYSLQPVAPQGRMIASPVAFVGKVFQTISYTHEDAPALNIAAFLFDNLTLHKKIREQGGAYGGGAVSNVLSGNFYFYSYRDPDIASTLEASKESIFNILAGNFTESDLEEAKLEMVQSLESPVSPGSRGDVAYNWLREGKTHEVRQKFRNKILTLTARM